MHWWLSRRSTLSRTLVQLGDRTAAGDAVKVALKVRVQNDCPWQGSGPALGPRATRQGYGSLESWRIARSSTATQPTPLTICCRAVVAWRRRLQASGRRAEAIAPVQTPKRPWVEASTQARLGSSRIDRRRITIILSSSIRAPRFTIKRCMLLGVGCIRVFETRKVEQHGRDDAIGSRPRYSGLRP